MQRPHASILVTLLLLGSAESRAQITDWSKVLHDLANGQDRPTQAAAEKLMSDALFPALGTESAPSLEKDVAPIVASLDDKDPQVRFKASAVLWALTMLSQNTTDGLNGVLPVLLTHFHGPDAPVRENVIRAVVALRPSIPPQALRELLPLIRDPDRTVQDVAIYGITRSAPQSPEALKALLDVLSEGVAALKVDALKDIGLMRLQDPAIIGKLKQLLSDKDRAVVLGAIVALDYAGPAAAPARAELERIHQNSPDPEVAKAAASAIAKIDRH